MTAPQIEALKHQVQGGVDHLNRPRQEARGSAVLSRRCSLVTDIANKDIRN
jgi:hypothetical protein